MVSGCPTARGALDAALGAGGRLPRQESMLAAARLAPLSTAAEARGPRRQARVKIGKLHRRSVVSRSSLRGLLHYNGVRRSGALF